jgi:peptide deformylase
MTTQLHLTENSFPLHLFLQRLERLIDIVVTNENLHLAACSISLDCYNRVGITPRKACPRSGGRYIMIACPHQPLSVSPFWESALAILKIARMGHPVLLAPAVPVPDPSHPEIQRLIDDMIETMLDAGGVGLAAPQVHVSLRLFVFHLPAARAGSTAGEAAETLSPQALINPEITPIGETQRLGWEGCLSIPGLRAAVPRFTQIRYAGLDKDGMRLSREAAGLHAVIVQHEYDHLDGILYPMRMSDFSKMGFNEELARFEPSLPAMGA